MITEIVTFKLQSGTTREQVFAKYEKTSLKWRANPDLIRENYLFDAEGGLGGGVYLWRRRADAEKWHGPEFRATIKEMWGSEPECHFFETPLVVDNSAGKIVEA